MKGMKKLLSILMVLTLVLSLGATAFAGTVTIDEQLKGHTFTAYQIFKGTQATDSGNSLASAEWGDDIDPDAFVAALKALDSTAFAACDAKDVNTVVKAISEYKGEPKAIAEAAVDSLKAGAAGQKFSESTTLDNGYYLIKDTTEGLSGENAYNDVVLQVTEDVKIDYKTDVPTSKKKVQDRNDTTGGANTGWQDSADWDIGDDVPFQLTGTLPTNYDDYDTYAITFHDKQSDGLTFKADTVEVKVGDKTLAKGVDYQVVAPGSDGCTFEIVITDLKKAAPEATSASVVEVTYESTLNDGAVVGPTGNPNDMTMDFSNNPHGEGTGTTPNDHVIVFTYQFNADKVNSKKDPLVGAGFTLLKKVAGAGDITLNSGTPYAQTYEGVEVVTTYSADGTTTEFDFKGLDDGEYILVESTVPAGYNKADDVEFKIEATHNEDAVDPKLLTFKATGNNDISVDQDSTNVTGVIEIEVVNNSGVELPETGGIGTTIFYIAGAILVAGAVILLVTKKRVSGMEK